MQKESSREKVLSGRFRKIAELFKIGEDNSVDLVYSSLVFHHLNSEIKKEAMKEIYRVLYEKRG